MRRALAFLTPLPVGRSLAPNASTLEWFPLAGALIGLAVGGAWWAAGELWTPLVAGVVVVAVDLALTGMLHVDGLVDTTDGLVPHLPSTARRLEVMATPDVGAFGLCAGVLVLVVRVAAFGSMAPEPLAVAALWCVGRTVMALGVRALPYARPGGGLASSFAGSRPWWPVAVLGAVVAVGLGGLAAGASTVTAVAIGALAGVAVLGAARRRLGGYTGDVLGAAGIVAETVGLLVAASTAW